MGVSSTVCDSDTSEELKKGSIPAPDPDPNSGVGVGMTVKKVSVLVTVGVTDSVSDGTAALDVKDVIGLSTSDALVKSEVASTNDGETNSLVGLIEGAGEMEMVEDSGIKDVSVKTRATVLVNGAITEVDMVSSTSVGSGRVATACDVSEVVASDTVSTVGVAVITSEAEVSKIDVNSTEAEERSDRRLELGRRTSVSVILTAVEPTLVGIGREVGNSSTDDAAKLKVGVVVTKGDASNDGEEGRSSCGIEIEKNSEVIGSPSALDDVSSTLSIVEVGDTTEDAADGCMDCSMRDGVGATVPVAADKRVLVATTGLTVGAKVEVMLISCNVSVTFSVAVSVGDGDTVNNCSEGL